MIVQESEQTMNDFAPNEVLRFPSGKIKGIHFSATDGLEFNVYTTELPIGAVFIIHPLEDDNDGMIHLDRDRAAWLLKQLQSFLETGELEA